MKKAGLFLLLFPPIWALLSSAVWNYASRWAMGVWWSLDAPWDTLFVSVIRMTIASTDSVILFWPVLAALGGAMLFIKK